MLTSYKSCNDPRKVFFMRKKRLWMIIFSFLLPQKRLSDDIFLRFFPPTDKSCLFNLQAPEFRFQVILENLGEERKKERKRERKKEGEKERKKEKVEGRCQE